MDFLLIELDFDSKLPKKDNSFPFQAVEGQAILELESPFTPLKLKNFDILENNVPFYATIRLFYFPPLYIFYLSPWKTDLQARCQEELI